MPFARVHSTGRLALGLSFSKPIDARNLRERFRGFATSTGRNAMQRRGPHGPPANFPDLIHASRLRQ